ncbi:MAG TPA: YgjV family protein [Steroidobacteraceae bacterium]|nr:YgjV family protein [Steroidobacteraceae bacterium]
MSLPVTETLGWIATLIFVGSYFFSKPAALRACQMVGATLWIVYGILIAAKPVIASNLLVFGAAAWTLVRKRQSRRADSAPATI